VSQLPKELNTSWWTTQNLIINAGAIDDAQGLVLVLDPSWSDAGGYLDIEVAVVNGSGVATAAVVSVNAETRGICYIPPALVAFGQNTIRLRAVGGSGGTTVVVWDQIRIETPVNGANPATVLGAGNGSDSEFASANYDHAFLAGNMVASDLPKELNLSWWNWEDVAVVLDAATAARGISITLDPAWADGTGLLFVEVGVDTGTEYVQVKTMGVNATTAGTAIIPAGLLKAGLNRIVVQAKYGTGGTTVVTWDQVLVEASSQYILGTHNQSDAEFAQSGYSPVYNASTQAVSQLPKELNRTWWTNQDITVNLDAKLATNGLLLTLDPSWSDGDANTGTLGIGVFVNRGSGFQSSAEMVCTVSQNRKDVCYIYPSFLAAGSNTIRLVSTATGTAGGTTVVTWDQIRIEAMTLSSGVRIGENDGSDAELAGGNYDRRFIGGHELAAAFPKELNTTWWNTQEIDFPYFKTTNQLAITLDPMWSDGSGTLAVQVSYYGMSLPCCGPTWFVAGTVNVNASTPATVLLPTNNPVGGTARIKLEVVGGTGGTTVAAWDRVWVE
jgi:hypothetical protein